MTHTTSLLRRVRSRIAATRAVEDLQRGLAVGGAVTLVGLAGQRFEWFALDPWTAVACGLGVAAVVPLVGLFVRRTDARSAAALADERLGLRERLSTALWCQSAPQESAAEPLGALVVDDAEHSAMQIRTVDVARVIRPRLLRRPMVAAGVAVAGCVVLLLWAPAARALESPEQKAARLAEQNLVAEVARALEQVAKEVEEAAAEKKQEPLVATAADVRRSMQQMQKEPPKREAALSKLNQVADRANAAARKLAGMREPTSPDEMNAQEKALNELLDEMSKAGIESLSKDARDLEQRLKADPKGDGAPSVEDIRALAARVDALRRAIERAKEAGADGIEKQLRALGNEDLLEKIAERMRELASKLEREGYEALEGEAGDGEGLSLADLSREELEELLEQLRQMESMEELAENVRKGAGQARGGRKIRFRKPGSGGT